MNRKARYTPTAWGPACSNDRPNTIAHVLLVFLLVAAGILILVIR